MSTRRTGLTGVSHGLAHRTDMTVLGRFVCIGSRMRPKLVREASVRRAVSLGHHPFGAILVGPVEEIVAEVMVLQREFWKKR